ncbi:hypothetical protein FEK35_09625 [Nocardia cyriacigeorgica]|uniref:DUF4254 domain-containing protein n=1 Tax=Nocardia cyriacigeorgica TaxID=135487 RepID=A0A5R8PGL9_9NOCA|nr:hypothetical protein FEK35_09625 [Nocardia cyriacigeorgica]
MPRKELLLAACRGLPVGDHPILDAAGELAAIHQAREQTPAAGSAALDRHRSHLRVAIDLWVAVSARPGPGGMHGVGRLVDDIAALTVEAHITLAQAPDALVYDATVRLTELGDMYQDLADQLASTTTPAIFR